MVNIAFTLLAAVCVWAIVSPRVPTGILSTLGLGLIVCACAAAIDDTGYLYRAFKVMVLGCLLIGAGTLWRVVLSPHWEAWHAARVPDRRPPKRSN